MKFRGFYLANPALKGFVYPIFEDKFDLFIQQSHDGEFVSGYGEINDLEDKRIIVPREEQIIAPLLGERMIYAFARDRNSVIIGSLQRLRSELRRLVERNDDSNDFLNLDIAIFLNDHELILRFGRACVAVLEGRNPGLSRKWLLGAPISSSAREQITNILNDTIDLGEFRHTGFRLSCLRATIRSIDDEANRQKLDRNVFISWCIRRAYAKYGDRINNQIEKVGKKGFNSPPETIENKSRSLYLKKCADDLRKILIIRYERFPVAEESFLKILIEDFLKSYLDLDIMKPAMRLSKREYELISKSDNRMFKSSYSSRARLIFALVDLAGFDLRSATINHVAKRAELMEQDFGRLATLFIQRYPLSAFTLS